MSAHRRTPSSEAAATQHIRTIRAAHGFDDNQLAPGPAVVELRNKLERALERLSNDLYNKKTHFLLEFIQNADDNKYEDGITPTLRLRIENRLVVFECNELGFSPENVRAICDIGASTKTREENPRGFIGEKGIGFKSVFTVADQVYINSGPYSFHFDKNATLGMITPALGPRYPARPGWTTFRLQLAPSENGNDLSAQLHDVPPTLLLFLRKLRALSIAVRGVTPGGATDIEVLRIDDDDRNMVSLERIHNGEHSVERYIIVRHLAQTTMEEPSRRNVNESEIVLAFPISEHREPVTKMQEVHAFLPLRCYGFKFIIQADFITSASREDVLASNSWNQALRGSVVEAFLVAINHFENDPTMRNVWFRYLPESISDSFFCFIEHKLLTELHGRPILRSSDGTYHRASQLFFRPLSFSDNSGAPLIPDECLPRAQRYLSADYDIHSDGQVLYRLGVREMTDDDFLESLAIMDKANMFGAQTDAWHDAVATNLLRLPRPHLGTIRHEVLPLRILPLHNGGWAPAALSSTFTFPPGVSIPDDLGLQSIAPSITSSSPRYQLFIRLGVMPPNPVPIARKILTVMGPRSVTAWVSHARFFFDHRREPNMPPAMRLRLADERGEPSQGDELYLDLPGPDGALPLSDALSPAGRFLHPDYLSAYPELTADDETDEDDASDVDNRFEDTRSEWLDWLRDSVGLNVVPRVVNGHLTPDFLDRAPTLNGRELLTSLRAWWPRLEQRLTEAGARALGAIPIAGRRLDTLYLRRRALAREDEASELPCIPVDDPEDRGWDFLERLGVATRLNASFFVNKLVHMQAGGEKDYKTVEDIYKQLDARFAEDEALIRKAFKEYPIILVSVKDEAERVWLHKRDVYWHGPPCLRSKAIISRSYPHLSNFFFTKLGIGHAPPYALVEELRMIAERYQRSPVSAEVQEHVAEILADISEVVQNAPNTPPSFAALPQIAVFPVQVPKEGIVLLPPDEFYVPDWPSKYADEFREQVGLLDLPDSVSMARIRPLLESDIFEDSIRYLDSRVTKRSIPQGKLVLDSETTELYSSRVEYIARLVLHKSNKSDIPPEQTKVLAKLHKINVISAQTINTTLSLDSYKVSRPEDVSFEETADKFSVALSRLLDVDMMTLFTCITQPVDVVSYLLEFNGIPEIPVDDGHDRSWLRAFTQPDVPIVPTTVVPERSPSPVPPPSPPPRSPIVLSVHEEEPFPSLGTMPPRVSPPTPSVSSSFVPPSSNRRPRQRSRASSSVGDSEHSRFMQSSRSSYSSGSLQPLAGFNAGAPINTFQDMGRLSARAGPFINGHQMIPGALPAGPGMAWPPPNNFNSPLATGETDKVGIMGEHFVYKLLVRMLDDFGPDNWTSELRHLVPGFTPFRAQAFADFTYLDSRGQLTRTWFGPEKAAAWQGSWPKYHIEVKSTFREENEPFHVSKHQLATAIAFTERFIESGPANPDLYVILRVGGIGTPEPSYMVYADPHRALFFGYLRCASDVYLQRNLEFQHHRAGV